MSIRINEKEGFDRLVFALNEIGQNAEIESDSISLSKRADKDYYPRPVSRMTLRAAFTADSKEIKTEASLGHISGEFIYRYPPGIPILAPGEEITEAVIAAVSDVTDLIKVVI